ncbi:uncharacterized protein TRAVEDRAFT_53581 [Trametes versicolor FP-101664 SS1]|uniref:uncharacterized protein n=1 Tax=Trametes versicolor (strain FP-101664) TaxID=717944 RepID=UPI000462320F|nr:uncharacterized protein TRAVEDRAFT_53581 [Trametes versicolor FP-101664 SS1]EIW52153.1 hypothetical protein TRAVEDRAFT_53581 [Trametes versicolor FP-101664 SS1]
MSSTAGPLLGSPPYATTLGAVALGGIVGMMLYGVTVHQTYRYYRLYPNDRTLLKFFVFLIFVLEAFHSLLWIIAGSEYHYLIAEPFNSGSLAKGHWSVRLAVIGTAFTVCTTQCFYASRIYFIGPKYKRLVIPALVLLVVSKGFAIAAGVSAFRFTPSIADFQSISWLVSVSYGLAGVTDVTLASTLVAVFRRSRTGSKRTDSVLDTLIIYSINTGVLTSVFSILAFIFALILPGNLIYAGLSIVGTKLYANSVLAVLNSRREINNRLMDDFTSFDLPEISSVQDGARRPEGIVSSLVWNAPQRSTSLADYDSIYRFEGMTFAAGRGRSCDEPAQGPKELEAGLGE